MIDLSVNFNSETFKASSELSRPIHPIYISEAALDMTLVTAVVAIAIACVQ